MPCVDAVARAADGRLVYTGWVRAPWGTMAERMLAPAGFPLPEEADPLVVAAGMNPAMSGWLPLSMRREEVGALGTVLVPGATGASGLLAVQAARDLGAERIIGAGRNAAALTRLADLGAETVSLETDDLAGAIVEALRGQAPGIVLDYVWGPVAEAAFAALQPPGTGDPDDDVAYLQIGSLAGPQASVPASLLRSRRIRLQGSGLGSVPQETLVAAVPRVLAALADGRLTIEAVPFGFGRVAQAWEYAGPGRAVVVPD